MRIVALITIFVCSIVQANNNADLIIFSFNRPLQLQALLESINYYITGLHRIKVIYRTTSDRAQNCYNSIAQHFPHVQFMQQSSNPHADFKPLTQRALVESDADYVVFAVDDIVIKDYIEMDHAIGLMQEMNAYGFYLRMGLHLDYCYTMNKPQQVPPVTECAPHVFSWTLATGEYDWGYPNTVDMTIYHKKDVIHVFNDMTYYTPNSLEGLWSMRAGSVINRIGLCYASSKIVNLPLNQVQRDGANRNMSMLEPDEQIELFEQGKKIDWQKLYCVDNKSAHMAYIPDII